MFFPVCRQLKAFVLRQLHDVYAGPAVLKPCRHIPNCVLAVSSCRHIKFFGNKKQNYIAPSGIRNDLKERHGWAVV